MTFSDHPTVEVEFWGGPVDGLVLKRPVDLVVDQIGVCGWLYRLDFRLGMFRKDVRPKYVCIPKRRPLLI